MKKSNLFTIALLLGTLALGEIQISQLHVGAARKVGSGEYYKLRWRAQITNTGNRTEKGNVWLGGTDRDGFTETQLSCHFIPSIAPGQSIKFADEATLTADEFQTYKKWVSTFHSLR